MNSFHLPGRRFSVTPLALSAALFIAACGGGGDSSAPDTPAAATAVPPVISAQPAEQAVTAGKVATFSVTASGSSLAYQWQVSKDNGTSWSNIDGATSAAYTVTATDPALNGTKYRVVISSAGLTTTSSPVTLTVAAAITAPVISVDVAAVSVAAGTDAAFSVTASGSTLAYQWQASTDGTTFANVAGATGATLTLPAVALADSGKTVRVAVTNSAGTVNSTAATLYVTPVVVDATLLSQPASMSATAPSQVTFTAGAAGSPAPTFQWQKSADAGVTWVDIAGATAASYTTPATAVADTGSLFRIKATNATATVTSDPATLTVAASPVPVAITTQPTALGITVPSTATFSVVASGSPTPTYQWQVKGTATGATFANITGATSTSYTTPATVAADSGKQYQVVVTNGSGSVTSAAATLTATVATTVSNLTGRAWTVGQSLETGDASVSYPILDTDDAGNAISLFIKSDGTRSVLYATRGVPGSAGVAPVWSAPVAIDTAAVPVDAVNNGKTALTVAPNGNALVTWPSKAACKATTYDTNLNNKCNYIYATRYSVATGAWSAPVQLADTGSSSGALTQRFNSQGDLGILYYGWVRNGTSYSIRPAVLWQGAGQSTFSTRVFSELNSNGYDLGLDKNGNLLLAGAASQNSTTDAVVYRGTVAAGFGAQELLEQRNSAVTFDTMEVGQNGQAVVTWVQNNGTQTARFAANIATPTAPWSVKDLAYTYGQQGKLRVTDSGDAILSVPCSNAFQRLSGGTWSGWQKYPAAISVGCSGGTGGNRNGDLLSFSGAGWTTYDAAMNAVIHANPNGALSVYGTSGGSLSGSYSLSVSGIAAFADAVKYDTLPTAAVPAGDGRNSVVNLWGLFLK